MNREHSPSKPVWSLSKRDPPASLHAAHCETWHRLGWSKRPLHTTGTREAMIHSHSSMQQQQQKSHQPGQLPRQAASQAGAVQQQDMRPMVAHTHSCTYMHSQKQTHTYRTTLMKQWVPGKDGALSAVLNTEGLCDELNLRLLKVDQTLQSLLGATQVNTERLLPGSSEAVRRQLGDSLEKQVAFSTALLLDWCGATPIGSCEQVLQQLTANQ